MRKNTSQLAEYINWVFKKYQEIQKEFQARDAYRIIAIQETLRRVELKVHVIGTGKQLVYTPEELACDDSMLEGFSKKDIRIIAFYACDNLNKPTHKIVTNTFCEKIKKMIFRVKKYDSNNFIEKTACELSDDQLILSGLSSEDAHRVGYVYGSESILSENEEKVKISNSNK